MADAAHAIDVVVVVVVNESIRKKDSEREECVCRFDSVRFCPWLPTVDSYRGPISSSFSFPLCLDSCALFVVELEHGVVHLPLVLLYAPTVDIAEVIVHVVWCLKNKNYN